MSRLSKSIQWISDDYVFGSTIKNKLNHQKALDLTRGLYNSKKFIKICTESRTKIHIIKHLRRIFPETTHIKDKIEVLSHKCSKKKIELEPLIEIPKKRLIIKENKAFNFYS
ncbi:hypothetical protein SteCoe_22771 [Stentor coeruleus]|uniref:Uncharacterized protein n=1 Tax=Stentor coeruleus TaxID=5963 RepID=A0A1R2BLF4_9CILI|nr:hypothetical protein SteCoe_22771 [Stentor coeruleus]